MLFEALLVFHHTFIFSGLDMLDQVETVIQVCNKNARFEKFLLNLCTVRNGKYLRCVLSAVSHTQFHSQCLQKILIENLFEHK